MNGEKKNIHFPHWTESMSWIRSLLINQTYENDLTLAIERDSLRSVSSTDGVSSSLLPVLFEPAISFILTFALNKALHQQPRAHVSLRVLAH